LRRSAGKSGKKTERLFRFIQQKDTKKIKKSKNIQMKSGNDSPDLFWKTGM